MIDVRAMERLLEHMLAVQLSSILKAAKSKDRGSLVGDIALNDLTLPW